MGFYDSSQPDFQERAFEIYRILRDDHPVYHDAERGFWALSRFEDVRAASQDAESFSSEGSQTAVGEFPQIQALDPPYHDRLRGLVSAAFSPRRVGKVEPLLRDVVRGLIDGFASKGRCDLLHDFARTVPNRVISELIGVPSERQEVFLQLAETILQAGDSSTAHAEILRPAAKRIGEEFAVLLEERRREPRDDLMSDLLVVEIDGRRLTDAEVIGFCFVLISAGSDTTTNLVVNGAVRLAEHPEQRRRLVSDPSGIPRAVEEMLRYDSPAQLLWRVARRDVSVHGVAIPEGAEVRLLWGAANHDEREFEAPERFDVTREIKRHLAFGLGAHFCLGANLARLEARVMFEELLARIPEYQLVSGPRWLPSIWARAYRSVPIAFELA